MSNNFLPTKDAEFGEWASAFAAYVVAHSGELPIIDSTEAAAMQSTVGNFRTKLTAAATAKDAASSAVELKDVAREETEDVIRTWAPVAGISDGNRCPARGDGLARSRSGHGRSDEPR